VADPASVVAAPAARRLRRVPPIPEATGATIPSSLRALPGPGAAPPTLGAFLDAWVADVVHGSVRPKTFASYRSIVRCHLAPALGHIALAELRPGHVQAYLNAATAAGLAPRTVGYHRNVLRQALGYAERLELVPRNVARLAVPPRIPRAEVVPLSPYEARRFLAAIRGDRLEAAYLLALAAGLRQGEILGLRWADLDFAAGTARIRVALQRVDGRFALVEPKSATSRRIVPLPSLVTEALFVHRERMVVERATVPPPAPPFADLVFTTTAGHPIDGINLTRRFQRILRGAGLPRQRFHDLRHACASLLLAQGVPARVVMETLGHSQISLTLNTYSHVIPALGREAARRMNAVLARTSD
jgi:integrase